MIDSLLRPYIAPKMDEVAGKVAQSQLTANQITLVSFALGFIGCFLTGMQVYTIALLFLLIWLFLDGLDGAVARATAQTELGAYLSMMTKVVIFAAFPFFFMLSQIEHSMAACILLFTYLLMGMANLSYDFFAMKKSAEPARGGIVENGEIVLFIVACCLYPAGFSALAAVLALMNLAAAIVRIGLTVKLLKN